MKVSEDRYARDLKRIHLAHRFIRLDVRTQSVECDVARARARHRGEPNDFIHLRCCWESAHQDRDGYVRDAQCLAYVDLHLRHLRANADRGRPADRCLGWHHLRVLHLHHGSTVRPNSHGHERRWTGHDVQHVQRLW